MSSRPGLLVTGASGFVGRHVVAAASGRFSVVATGREARPEGLPGDVEWRQADLLSRESVAALPADLPFVLHLASETVPSKFSTYEPLAESVEMTLNLTRHLRSGRLIYVSSCLVYGLTGQAVTEDAPSDPRGGYGLAKAIGETIALRALHLDPVVVRPFNHIGAGMRSDLVIPAIVERVRRVADGDMVVMAGLDSVRDFLDVADIVKAYFALFDLADLPARVFNVCSGQATRIGEVVRLVARLLDKPIAGVAFADQPNSADDISVMVGNAQRLRLATGWRPDTALADSLRKLIEGMPLMATRN